MQAISIEAKTSKCFFLLEHKSGYLGLMAVQEVLSLEKHVKDAGQHE